MKKPLMTRFLILTVFQFLIIMISFFTNHTITLLSYINISFYFSSLLLLTSLLVYTIQTGFFDVISKSLNLFFTRGQVKRKFEEIPSLSELVSFDQKPLLFYGFSIGLLMLIALFFFYI